MEWTDKNVLRPAARMTVARWELMNRDVAENAVCIPVSSTSAVVVYEQDHVEYSFFFFIPKGDKDAIIIRDESIIPEGTRRFRSRVEQALQAWRMRQREAEKQRLLNT